MSYFQKVKEFHAVFDRPIRTRPEICCVVEEELRKDLLAEEVQEYEDAVDNSDIVEIADALADIIYIVCGTALYYGIPLDVVFEEVHRSNMAKVGSDGKVKYREDGKVLKPEGWKPPDIKKVLDEARAY